MFFNFKIKDFTEKERREKIFVIMFFSHKFFQNFLKSFYFLLTFYEMQENHKFSNL